MLIALALLATAPPPSPRVILVTLDGVRREDIRNPAHFPKLHQRGLPIADFEVANTALISLPAYQSIFLGVKNGCDSNDCPTVDSPTFVDRLAQLWKEPEQVAVFSSWERISRAVAVEPARIHLEAGLQSGEESPPWRRARYDVDTWAKASRYLSQSKPRFLYLSFNDADEWAHKGNVEQFNQALQRYDGWLDTLFEQEKDATILITTDHGRGVGTEWSDHSNHTPSAKFIWLVTRGLSPAALKTHLDLRPAIEKVFGL
jgi:hypothetical protein